MAKITIVETSDDQRHVGDEHVIPDGARLTIGRSPDNDIQLHDAKASRNHCYFEKTDAVCTVVDRGSQNGTLLNGQPVHEERLRTGDLIRVGLTVFRFDEGQKAEGHSREDQIAVEEGGSPTIKSAVDVGEATFLGPDAQMTDKEALVEAQRAFAVLCRAADTLPRIGDRANLIEQSMDLALEMVETDRGFLALVDDETGALKVKTTRPRRVRREQVSISSTILHRAMETKQAVLTVDAMDDPRFRGHASIMMHHIRSAVYVPLKSSDKVIGLLGVDTPDPLRRFTETQLNRLCVLANHIAVALGNLSLQAALRESEEKYRTLFQDSLEAMSVTRAGKILDVNPAWLQMHGFENRDEVIGMDIINILHPDDHAILAERRKAAHEERERVYQLRDIRKDGTAIDVEVYSSAIMLGGELAILSTVHDITERKRLQQEVIQADKMAALGTMISGVAHELNNPLTAISAHAYLLGQEQGVTDTAREDVKLILSEVERCAHIVEGLLRFARRSKEEKAVADLNEALKNSVDLRRYDMQVNNIEVVEEYDPKLPKVFVNAWQFQQVFLNIINNAYDAITGAKSQGRVVVRTKRAQDQIVIEIEDSGGGIKEPDRVFEPFYTTKEVGKGTGLGLSIAYGIVRDHDGSIQVENTGAGARFTIRIPIVADQQEKPKEAPPQGQTPSSPGKRILVIDDEPPVAEAVRLILSKRGYVVEACHSPEAALDKLTTQTFDLVLSDLMMPGTITARDLYDWIQVNMPKLAARVVFMTGSVTGKRTHHLLKGISVPVVMKPFRPEQLCEVVNKAMLAGAAS